MRGFEGEKQEGSEELVLPASAGWRDSAVRGSPAKEGSHENEDRPENEEPGSREGAGSLAREEMPAAEEQDSPVAAVWRERGGWPADAGHGLPGEGRWQNAVEPFEERDDALSHVDAHVLDGVL